MTGWNAPFDPPAQIEADDIIGISADGRVWVQYRDHRVFQVYRLQDGAYRLDNSEPATT